MLQDPKIMNAVSKILQRSERQIDDKKIVDTFVDLGILSQLSNRNNQIIYGRRGTGKTHVFRVLTSQLEQESNSNIVVYVDSRTLGSSAQFSDTKMEMERRVLALLRDIFGPIYNSLLDHIINEGGTNAEKALKLLDTLLPTITESDKILLEGEKISAVSSSSSENVSSSLEVKGPVEAQIGLKEENTHSEGNSLEQKFSMREDKVIFPSIGGPLTELLDLTNAQLYILIDEWSSLPIDIHPYLAEFIKRTLLPIQRITTKIAALEYRSQFSMNNNNGYVGFELGADISTAPDLDDYYVYDRDPDRITNAYGDILLRHINVELDSQYMVKKYGIKNGSDFASRLFTQRPTMQELARATEGVIRDLINIFTKAFFHAQRRGRDTIDQKAVIEGAREWFEQDKARGLNKEMNNLLRRIVDEVIGSRKARSFLMQKDLERHPTIQRLIDARVLHHMERGYADKDNPGVRYNIYSLDYGTYVDLIGTSKQPQIELKETTDKIESIVPFDDKRSIRRIILNADILK